jgi:hypothetical protein
MSAMGEEAEPEATEAPWTVMLPPLEAFVGVTVTLATAFATLAEYEVVAEAKVGDRVPTESVRDERSALLMGSESSKQTPCSS